MFDAGTSVYMFVFSVLVLVLSYFWKVGEVVECGV